MKKLGQNLKGYLLRDFLTKTGVGVDDRRFNFHPALIFLLFLITVLKVQGQSSHGDASRIFTDYNGYWTSGTGNISKIKPDNSHNLIGFTWGGQTYSTGVNDARLVSNAIDFMPAEYQAFPIRDIESTSGTYIGWGQMKDGVNNGIASSPPFPVPPILANYLTDGLHGLDIGTGVANIKAGVLVFNFTGIIDKNQIGDGHPDILVTQIANPANTTDEVYLTDDQGRKVGNSLSVTYNDKASVGTWTADFYHLNGTKATFENEDRNLWLWGAELSAFGIDQNNYHRVKSMRYKLNGSSDPAFAAYKVGVFDIISANDDEAESEQGEPVEIHVLQNDQPSRYLDPGSVRITTLPAGGTVTTDPLTGAILYTPDASFYGVDTFVYEVCSNASEADLCDEALVGVSVRAYILPIQLSAFSADLVDRQQTKIQWTTLAETHNAYFEIEHSSNGTDWKTIKTIAGAGNSSSARRYTVIDLDPVNGYNYYRLKQVDLDGRVRIFEAISVKAKIEALEGIIVFPNPSSGIITIKGEPAELMHLSVINPYGQLQVAGVEVTRVSDRQVRLNMENLCPGMYIIRTATGGKVIRKR